MDPFLIIGALVFISIVFMIVVIWFLHRYDSNSFGILVLGGLGYFIAEVILREPAVTFLVEDLGSPLFMALVLGGSAALVETIARYVVLRYGIGDRLSWLSGGIAGIGFGFCELTFAFVLSFGMSVFLHMIGLHDDSALLSAFQEESMYLYFIAFLEQIFLLSLQIAFMLAIAIGMKKNKGGVVSMIVFSLQLLFMASMIYMKITGIDLLFVETYVALWAVGAIFYILQTFHTYEDDLDIPEDAGEQAVKEGY